MPPCQSGGAGLDAVRLGTTTGRLAATGFLPGRVHRKSARAAGIAVQVAGPEGSVQEGGGEWNTLRTCDRIDGSRLAETAGGTG